MDNLTVVIFAHKQIGVLLTGAEIWKRMGVKDIRVYFPSNIQEYVETHSRYEELNQYKIIYVDILTPNVDINSSGYKECIAHVATVPTANHLIFCLADVWVISPTRFRKIVDDWVSSDKQFFFYWTQVGGRGFFFDVPSSDFFGIRDDGLRWLTRQQLEDRFYVEIARRRGSLITHPFDPRVFEATWENYVIPLSWYEINTKDTPYMQYGYKNFGIGHFHHDDIRQQMLDMTNQEMKWNVTYDEQNPKAYKSGLPYVEGYLRKIPAHLDENLHTSFMYACDTSCCGDYLDKGSKRL